MSANAYGKDSNDYTQKFLTFKSMIRNLDIKIINQNFDKAFMLIYQAKYSNPIPITNGGNKKEYVKLQKGGKRLIHYGPKCGKYYIKGGRKFYIK